MGSKTWIVRLSIMAVALVLVTSQLVMGTRSTSNPPSRSSLNRDLRRLNNRIKNVQSKLRRTKHEKRSISNLLVATQRRLDSAQDKVTRNKIELLNAQGKLRIISARLDRKEREFKRRSELLSDRIADVYEGSDIGYLEVLLGSRDMQTFLSRGYYIKQIVASDVELVDQIKKDKEQIERDKKSQDNEVKRVASIQEQLIRERDNVSNYADDKQAELDTVEHDLVLYERMLAELAAESDRIESQLQRYQSKGNYKQTFTGGLIMPVSGRISSKYGYRIHPITGKRSLHTGVDIACPSGTSIKSAANGEVVQAGWMGAYGNAVIIDHGGYVSTLYGHNSKLLVKVGDKVKQGQVIAKAGSTGWSTGPHCHFEKRVHGKPVNPM